eukprot:TRINITY_DN1776_c1_g1_i4.p1 TRINITY_DN1776_c1_g1~~TRINITY_DN1776_c1_g1_i4.p1  ORF type:complete len:1577 (+),score=552.58 TRINITY_DN1776_c1_g1_i4:257-4987(+)
MFFSRCDWIQSKNSEEPQSRSIMNNRTLVFHLAIIVSMISLTMGFSVTSLNVPTGQSIEHPFVNDEATTGFDDDFTQITYDQNARYTFTILDTNCTSGQLRLYYRCESGNPTSSSTAEVCYRTQTSSSYSIDESDVSSCGGVTCTPSNFKLYATANKASTAKCVVNVRINATHQCNSQGTYDPDIGKCRCNSPYAGATCDKQVITLADNGLAGSTSTLTLDSQEEAYFTFTPSQPLVNKDVLFNIDATDACTANLDLYLYWYCGTSYTDTDATSSCYNRWSGTARDTDTSCTSSDCLVKDTTYNSKSFCGCSVTSSNKASLANIHYDFRVKYASNNPACTFTVNMTADSYCVNGNWDQTVKECRCNSPWSGSRCNKPVITLADNGGTGTLHQGELVASGEDYFTFQQANQGVPKDIRFVVTAGACQADLDIYLYSYCGTSYTDVTTNCYNRWSSSLKTSDQSCSGTCKLERNTHATTSTCGCSITSSNKADADKQHFDYVIKNSGSVTCPYNVTLYADSDCLHGTFTGGKCICNSPYAGPKCDQQVEQLPFNGAQVTAVNKTLAAGQDLYFTTFVGGGNGKIVKLITEALNGGTCVQEVDTYMYYYCGDSYTDTSGCNRWSGTATDSAATTVVRKEVENRNYNTKARCGCDISSSNTLTETYRDVGRLHYDFALKNTGSSSCEFTATLVVEDECEYRGVQTHNHTGSTFSTNADCICQSGWSGANCRARLLQLQPNVKQTVLTERYTNAQGKDIDTTNVVMYMDQPRGNYEYTVVSQQTLGVGSNCGSSTTKTLFTYIDCDNTCGGAAVNEGAFDSVSMRLLNTESTSTKFGTDSTTSSKISNCGCDKENVQNMRTYFRVDTGVERSCSFDITMTRNSVCTPADCWGNGTCTDGGLCECKEGFEGITCYERSNSTNFINEIYANSEYSIGSRSGEPAVIWFQVSKSNSVAQLKVVPTTTSTLTTLNAANSGTAYVMAKWLTMPKFKSAKTGFFGTYTEVGAFTCEDCDYVKSGPLKNNITLDVDPSSMEGANQGLYVVIGVSGFYQARTTSLNSYQRSFKVFIDIQDPNGALVIVIFVIIILAIIGYVYYGVKTQKYNPKDHAKKASEVFNNGFLKLEAKMIKDMRGAEDKQVEEEEEEEEEDEEEGEKNEVDEAKDEAKEEAKAGVEMAQVEVKQATEKAATATKTAAAGAAKTVTDPLQIVLIILTNLVTLFFSIIKTLFNISLLFRNFSGYFPAMNINFYTAQIAIVLGGLGDLLIGFNGLLRGVDIVGAVGSEWNCGGAGVLLAPFILAIGALFLRVLLKRDFLLLSTMWLNSIKKRQPAGKRRAVIAGLCNSANAIIFYTVQIIVLTIGGLTANLLGGRNCGAFDLVIRSLGAMVVAIMLLVFFVMHFSLFAGDDPIVQKMNDEEKKEVLKKTGYYGMLLYFLRGLYRLFLLMFGIWKGSQVRAFRIKERAEKYDDDDEDDDTQHEAVIAAVGKSSGLIWLLFPLMIVATKITEALNNPAALTFFAKDDDKLDMITESKQRYISFVSNLLNMLGIVIFVASADVGALVLALLALLPPFVLALWNELRGGTA